MSALIAFLMEPLFIFVVGIILLLSSVWVRMRFWGFVGLGILGYLGYNMDFDPRYFWLLVPYSLAGFAFSLFSYREYVEKNWKHHLPSDDWDNRMLSPSENSTKIVNWIIFWPVDLFVQLTYRFTDVVFATVKSGFVKIFEAQVQKSVLRVKKEKENGV